MEEKVPRLDLATAAAISGAAVSSSMGRFGLGLLGPTLALLNLRLGFWLHNPGQLGSADTSKRDWDDTLRLYLFREMLGRLSSDSSRIYITDGGHIDNIGLYQLLKRRCKFIIVVDAEADAAMNFGAFCDVQRFVRIDEGTRITLDWQPVRAAALARSADRIKQVSPDDPRHALHYAVGKILYETKATSTTGLANKQVEEGILLYVKASVTGDEADYVLDYERRYPNFPHEFHCGSVLLGRADGGLSRARLSCNVARSRWRGIESSALWRGGTRPVGSCRANLDLPEKKDRRKLSFSVTAGRLALGTWQGIFLFEHRDAPHRREVVLHLSD